MLIESPVLWIGNDQLIKDCEKARQLPPRCMSASAPTRRIDQQPGAGIVKSVEELEQVLRNKGMGPARLMGVVDVGAQDNEAAWSRRLPEAMLFLYGK